MSFCPNCGTMCQDTATFCPNCGNSLVGNTTEQAGAAGNYSGEYPTQQPVQQQQPMPQGYPVQQQPALPMKWYKFLIYFALFAGGILNFIQGINYITGDVYAAQSNLQVTAETVYSFYGNGLKVVDILFGVLLMLLGVFQIFTRFQLARYKKKAPLYINIVYGAMAGIEFLYFILTKCVGVDATLSTVIAGGIAYSIVFLCNYVYFKKRKHLFVNGN